MTASGHDLLLCICLDNQQRTAGESTSSTPANRPGWDRSLGESNRQLEKSVLKRVRLQERIAMPYQPIEDYGIIGNMRTVALVGINGSIDWHCSPNFDSSSVFGALLDDAKGGRFQIAPVDEQVRRKQFYWPSTNILVTRFSHEDGIVELEDFMPVGFSSDSSSYHQLHRRVRCVRGPVRLFAACRPAFDYGRQPHQVQLVDGGASFHANNVRFSL